MRKCAAFRPRRSRYRSRAVNQMAALIRDTLEGLLPSVYTGLLGTLTSRVPRCRLHDSRLRYSEGLHRKFSRSDTTYLEYVISMVGTILGHHIYL